MRYRSLATALLAIASGAGLTVACSNGDNTGQSGTDAATNDSTAPGTDSGSGADASAVDAASGKDAAAVDATVDGGAGNDAGTDGGSSDASTVDATSAVTFLAHLSTDPEGLWQTGNGTPLVGLTGQAQVVTVTDDGGTQTFAQIGAADAATATNTLGIISDPSGAVFVAVGTFSAPDAGQEPPVGVYKIPADGGTPVLFSSAPDMTLPNGFDFNGATLFVADSNGHVFTISPEGGAPAVWTSDPLLAPDAAACNGILQFQVGANGIVHDSNNVYVSNSNFGRIVKIPLLADGGPGTPVVLIENCAALAGADGVVLDTKDGTLIVAVNVQNKIVRVSPVDAGTSVIASGDPLDFPASVIIQSDGGTRRVVFTNAALAPLADGGTLPGVLAVPIP